MENKSKKNQGRENFDTENEAASNQKAPQAPQSHPEEYQNLNSRYDTDPNRHNFGLDDSPLDSADWKTNADLHAKEKPTAPTDSEAENTIERDQNRSFDRDI